MKVIVKNHDNINKERYEFVVLFHLLYDYKNPNINKIDNEFQCCSCLANFNWSNVSHNKYIHLIYLEKFLAKIVF